MTTEINADMLGIPVSTERCPFCGTEQSFEAVPDPWLTLLYKLAAVLIVPLAIITFLLFFFAFFLPSIMVLLFVLSGIAFLLMVGSWAGLYYIKPNRVTCVSCGKMHFTEHVPEKKNKRRF